MSFRQVQTHGHVYADAYYLTVEERNQVYQCQYGRSYHASLVRDMFVFQCLVGCRMGDLFNLTRSTIDDEMKLVNYANDIAHKHTVIIASAGVSTTSNATIVASFKAQARMRPSLKNFVGHISLSFHPDDTPRLTNEFMAEVAQEYLRRRGIVNTQFVIFRHHDQPHGHVHIVYNRVDNDGNAIKGDCNFRASAAVTKALTREYGLTFGKGKRDVRRSHLKGRDAVKYQLYDTISAVLSHCHDWQTLRTA
ncbi:MAG: relaxase/mobilization nuclease domain-containing protein, partial [Bacteroidales bacterium]|nr:relaxase/mobilization nuclease domain-containing protein [Bacteroidales bacterium]